MSGGLWSFEDPKSRSFHRRIIGRASKPRKGYL